MAIAALNRLEVSPNQPLPVTESTRRMDPLKERYEYFPVRGKIMREDMTRCR